MHRSTYRRKPKPRPDDGVRARMLELSRRPRRRGCPWMYRRLRKDGFRVNHKRVERIYREEGLQLPRRRPSKRFRGTVVARPRAMQLNEIWCMDFIEDSTWWGRKVRILNLLDEYSRLSIDAEVAGSIPGVRVRSFLERAIAVRGAKPRTLIVDNGPEFICNEIEVWAGDNGVSVHFIRKGKPTQNCFVESFHATMRRELLNAEVFVTMAEAEAKVHQWRRYYNDDREHSSLGWLTPTEFEAAVAAGPSSPPAPAAQPPVHQQAA
jgi:putative transposase